MKKLKKRQRAERNVARDIFFILVGVGIAIVLAQSGFIDWLITSLGGGIAASFVAGIFFTSAFTLAPASIALAHIAQTTPIATIALWGSLGAVCGDLILFFFIRDRFADDIMNALKPSFAKYILSSFHVGFLKWLAPLIGALIIASPLPDEFGLTLMGLSKTKVALLIPIAFVMNMIGIYFIVWLAGAI